MNEKISVVISTYDDPVNFVEQCLNSLLFQENIHEIIIMDSSKEDKIKKLCLSINGFKEKVKYHFTPPRGLSDARNKGMDICEKNIVAFTDSDCIVDKDWAKNICKAFNNNIGVVGGKVFPKWVSKPNKILFNSAIAQGFYSSFDAGDKIIEVDQIFGGNFAVNKTLVKQYFSSDLGRKSKNLLGGEELEFCRRVKNNNLKIIYDPSIIVLHQIPEERIKFKWMWRRMYYGGAMRSLLGGKPTPKTVNFVSYNLYDLMFLTMFIAPYLYGLLTYRFRKN